MTGVVSTNPPNYSGTSTNQGYSLTPQGGLRVQPMSGGADVSPTNPLPVTVSGGSGSASIATAQVSVASSSTAIVTARAGRLAVTITNLGTVDVYLGPTGVTSGTGTLLPGVRGAQITIPTTAAIFGATAAGSQSISVLESF